MNPPPSPLHERRAGVLLHPTSLPSALGKGDLGPHAYRFVEFLAAGGMGVWQVLPLSPPHDDDSPYHCLSTSAGNPLLISPELLVEQGWLDAADYDIACAAHNPGTARRALLAKARQGFLNSASAAEHEALSAFIAQHAYWLEDYALFQALRETYHHTSWIDWPTALRDRAADALTAARSRLQKHIAQIYFEQFIFFRQWHALKQYANAHGVLIFGDMPIFVAHDSADVWAQRRYFELDDQGRALLVTGVPPDYFSADGQRWGHPHYRWEVMRADGFGYWVERMKVQLQLFDILRIDHFRGFESYWEIPATSATAKEGRWVKAPGDELFQLLQEKFGTLPVVAEDLGLITPEVHALRNKYGFPRMLVLHFAFDGSPENPYVPYRHEVNSVVYTGTHDNDTTLGWFSALPWENKNYVDDYLGAPGEPMPWPLIRCALASVARWAVIPMQDILMLGSEHRMNTPGTSTGNWQWQFSWEQLPLDVPARLHHLSQLYGRS